jgi:hypothetical protein
MWFNLWSKTSTAATIFSSWESIQAIILSWWASNLSGSHYLSGSSYFSQQACLHLFYLHSVAI